VNNKLEQWYKLNSMSSISAYDLAQIIQHIYQLKIDESLFNTLPKEVKHHFQKITETEAKEN